ncbi:hypothetical protein Fmac_025381 [Flemingia macrophylla]|uniref:Uncharacterized protein n=1 Tax=Flemingia macrophylla TaxID=520843 RepID=A0ABD1LS23_9FABA
MDVPLPLDKLALDLIHNKPLQWKQKQLARDALSSDGFCVIGGYMSPVNDAYKKKMLNKEHERAEDSKSVTRSTQCSCISFEGCDGLEH